MENFNFKRFLSLAMAIVMVLSYVPVNAFATEPECAHAVVNVTTTATCTEAGVKTSTCGTCGATISTEDVEATGHTFVDGVCSCGEYETAPASEPTEPEATTEPTEPEATTEPTEPEATTEPTEPEATTEPTEPEATTEPTEPEATEPEVDELVVKVQAMIDALRTTINAGEEAEAFAEYEAATAAIAALTEEQRAQLDLTNYYAAAVPTVIPVENPVAKVGDTEYATIDEAIEAWIAADTKAATLTLLSDVTLSDVVTLNSTKHHTLNLGTYTLTAAEGKNAFVIKACGTGSGEQYAITINADTTNPGGIDAGNKCIVYYKYADGGITTEDRPIIKINGGVFTGSTSSFGTAGIYTIGSEARKCATLNISGGTFNCSINGSGKSKLLISGGTFNYSVGSQGDSTALRLISGGTFKTFGFMTADSKNTKFWFGTSMNNSNVGVHVDDNGYIVVGGPVITEAGDTFEAFSTNYSGANSLLQYSSAKNNGLYYTSVEEAFADNNTTSGKVTVYVDELDMTGINFKGTIVAPEGQTLKITNAPEGLKTEGNVVIVKPVAKIGETPYTSLEEAFAAANAGDTVVIMPGEYGAINISKKNITVAGTVGENGELLTTIKGGNPAISGHGFNGTIKDLKIVDAFKVMYAEPAGNVTVDNVYVTGATYGFHLVAYSKDLTWTIQNSYMDLSWANSFGVYGGDAEIIVKGNRFESTAPYYPDYGALPVNTFLPNVTVEENIFGENTKILITESVTDTSKINISKNYHADGVENAFVEDSYVTVDIPSWYTELNDDGTIDKNSLRELPRGDNFNGYTGTDGIWGEVRGNATESFVIKVLDANGNVMGTTSLNNIGGIINGNVNVTWNLKLDAASNTDEYWTMEWTTAPSVDNMPAKVELWVDGVKVSGGNVQLNGPDGLNKIVAAVADDSGKILGYHTTLADAAAAAKAGDEIVLLADATVEGTLALPAGIKLTSNGHTINGSIRMLGDLTLNGDLTITGGLWVGKSGETLEATLSGDKLTAGYFMFQRGTYTINADIDAVYGYLSFEGTFEVNSTIHTTGANGEVLYINGNVTLNDGAVLDSDNSVFVNNDNAVLTLKAGSKVDSNVKITASGAELYIDAEGLTTGNYTAITGTVTNSVNGTIGVVGNDKLEAKIVDGKIVLAERELSGSGTEADPYLINNVNDLILFRDSVNAGKTKYNAPGVVVALTADIDLAGATWERGIGDGINATFDGIFDGKNFTIKNLNLAPKADSDKYFCGGLFGYTFDAAVIKNVVLENITVTAEGEGHNVGALVGFAYNKNAKLNVSNVTVKNVTINASGTYGVGAIVGYSHGAMGTISGCTVDGATITGHRFVGGITGYSYDGAIISGCAVKNAAITGEIGVGGVAGLAHGSNTISGNTVVDTTVTATENKNWGYVVGELGSEGAVVENNTAAEPQVGGSWGTSEPVQAKIGNKYYTTFAAAYAAAKDNETITLLAPIVIAKGETLTLDKNVNIEYTSNVVGEDMITVRGTLNVAAGKITYINTDKTGNNVTVSTISAEPGSVVNVTGGTIENKTVYSTGSYAYAIDLLTNGSLGDVTVTISNGAVYSDYMAIRQFNNGTACKNTLTVSGGEIYGAKRAIQVHLDNNAAYTTISGGEIKAGEGGYALCLFTKNNENLSVEGGNFIGSVYSATNGFISGGTFTEAVEEVYCAAGLIPTKNTDGTYGVKTGKFVARNTTTGVGYETIQAAINAANAGETITLLADVNETAVILIDKSLTINGDDHKVTSSATRVFRVTTANTVVTLNGVKMVSTKVRIGTNDIRGISIDDVKSVKLTLNNCSVDFTDASACDWSYAVNVVGGSGHTVTVNGGTYEGANVINVRGAGQSVVVKNTTLNCLYPNNDLYFGACIYVVQNQGSSVEATGNTFNGSNALAFNLGNTTLTESNNTDNTKYVIAKVGTEYFTSLAEAFAAAQDGDTITLLQSFETTESVTNAKKVTLNLNGKTITGTDNATGSFGLITNKSELTITGNGTITLKATNNRQFNSYSSVISNTVGGKLVVENGTIEHLGGTDMAYGIDNLTNGKGTYAETIINGGTIKSTYRAIRQFLNGIEADNILTVNGGTIEGANKSIWMQDPSANANTGSLTVGENAALKGNVYLTVTAGSTSWPVEVAIAAAALKDNAKVLTSNVPNGYELANIGGVYGIMNGVAKIGNQYFATLQDAFKAATEGCTIEILSDVIVDSKWDCRDYATNGSHSQFKESVTINGNGHTIKFTAAINDNNWNTVFRFEENATVKNLTVDISEATGAQRVISAKKSLTVDGLTIIGSAKYGVVFGEGASAADLAAAEIVVKNSTLTGTRRAISDNEGGKDVKSVVITDNTLSANVYVSASESVIFNNNTTSGEVDIRSYSAENVLSVEAKDNTLTAGVKNYIYAKNIDAQAEFTAKNPPLKVSNKAELNAALAAAKDGDVIILTADIDYGTDQLAITKAITLDLDGKTLTTRNAWGGMSVKGNPTIKNGTIVHASNTAAIKVWNATAFEDLVIDVQGKGDANKTIGGIVLQSGTTTRVGSIKNVTIKGAALTNGIETYNCGDATENVIGSMENVNIDAVGTAMLISAPVGTATGCTFDGGVNGVELWIKGNYSASLNLVNSKVEGGVYAHDEFSSNPDVVNNGTLSLTVDEATTGADVEDITLEIARAEKVEDVLKEVMENSQAKLNNTYYATLAEAIADAQAGSTITLLANVDLTESMVIPASKARTASTGITLDLAGKTITGTDNATGSFALININPDADLTINDTVGGGKITLKATNNRGWGAYSSVISNQRGKLTVNGGTIEHLGGTDMAYGIDILTNTGAQNAETVINGGIIKSTYRAIRQFLNSTTGQNILTVNGGTIEGTNKSIWMQDANKSANPGTLTVGENAALKGNVYLTVTAGSTEWPVKVAIADDALTGDATVLTSNVPAKYVVKNVNGTWGVHAAPVAKIGKVEYTSLQAAVDAAKAGATITLIRDAEGAGVVIDKNLTIDFAGFTYTLNEGVGSTGTESNGFQILKGNTVTLKYGTLKVADSAKNDFYILIQNYANLTVLDMILDGKNLDKYSGTDGDSYVVSNNSGKVSINRTTITANDDGALAFAFDACDQRDKGYDLPVVTVYPSTVIEGKIEAAAKVGNSYYATLEHTVENAVAGKTITLQGNVSGAGVVIDKNLIIDFAGYTYTLTEGVGSTGTETNGFQILKGNTVTLKNGTLKVDDEAADKFYILIQNYADLTVNKMILDGSNLDKYAFSDGDSYTLSNNSGKVTIGSGTQIIANKDGDKAYAFDVCDQTAKGYDLPVVTVNKSATIDGNIEAAAKIGNVYYATLNAALAAATNNQTVTLVNDINVDATDAVKTSGNANVMFAVEGKSITLDMNGKKIDVNYDSSNLLYSVVYVADGASLKVTGNGTIDLTTGETKAGKYDCVAYMFWKHGTTGNLTVENGTFTANKVEDSMVYTNGDKIVNVKGGTWTLGNVGTKTNGSPWIFNTKGTGENSILVSGGTYNFNIGFQFWAHEVDIVDAKGNPSYVVDNLNGTWTVNGAAAEAAIMTDVNGDYDYPVAYATFADAVKAIAKGAPETTIKLLKDITVNNVMIGHQYTQNIVVDLNGKTMTASGIAMTSYRNGTVLTVQNGTVKGNSTSGTLRATYGGEIVIGENLTVACAGGAATGIYVDNGKLFIDKDVQILTGKFAIRASENAANKLTISAGTYKTPIEQNWCAEGYIPTDKLADGYYSVAKDPSFGMVAKITNGTTVSYAKTLAEAIASAESGATITLLTDIAETTAKTVTNSGDYATIYNVANKAITIDLNGKKITVTASAADLANAKSKMLMGVFTTDVNGALTLKNGSVEVVANDAIVYALATAYGAGSKLVIESGSYTADVVNSSLIYSQYDEIVTINGGTFNLGNVGKGPDGNGSPWIFNAKGQNTANIIVTGGTFNADIQHQHYPFEVQMPETLALKNENGMYTVVEAVAYVTEREWSSKWYTNNVGYATLEEAIAACEGPKTRSGKTSEQEVVVLLKDITLDETLTIGKTVVLDLNGKTISQTKECTASYEMIANNGNLTINDTVGTGKIILTDTGAGDSTFGWGSYTIRNAGTLVVNGGTIEFVGSQTFGTHCSLAIFQYSGSTTINGGNIINNSYRSVRLWKGDMTINGGTFEGQTWVHCVDDSAKLTINGGSFAPAKNGGDGSSVFVNNSGKKAELSITGGYFATKVGANDVNALAGCITGGEFTEAAKANTNPVLFA